MREQKFDVVVLGTGPAASQVAVNCAGAGWQVAIVDGQGIGGTCALRGCNPKKVLTQAAELVDWVRRSSGQLIAKSSQASIEWSSLIAFKRTFTQPIEPNAREKYAKHQVNVFSGEAKFIDHSTVEVGDVRLRGGKFVIATGAEPAKLKFVGADRVTSSDDFLELEALPPRIVFLGGGFISFEFAHVAARAGAAATILHNHRQPLKQFDPDLVGKLIKVSSDLGVRVMTEVEVASIEPSLGGGLHVVAKSSKKPYELQTDLIVHGAGRVPAIAALNLDRAGVEASAKGVRVNEYLQSISNSNVYAAGDVADTGQPSLTPIANEEGRVVTENLLYGNRQVADYGFVPRVLYTAPPLASVGMLADEARDDGHEVDVHTDDMTHWSDYRKIGATAAAYKIVVEKHTRRILGAHLLGPDAAETINLFALAMKCDLTADKVASVLFGYPTFGANLRRML